MTQRALRSDLRERRPASSPTQPTSPRMALLAPNFPTAHTGAREPLPAVLPSLPRATAAVAVAENAADMAAMALRILASDLCAVPREEK